jgi:hypothetical protein
MSASERREAEQCPDSANVQVGLVGRHVASGASGPQEDHDTAVRQTSATPKPPGGAREALGALKCEDARGDVA